MRCTTVRRRDEGILVVECETLVAESRRVGEQVGRIGAQPRISGYSGESGPFYLRVFTWRQAAIVLWLSASSSVLDAHSDCAENMSSSLEVPEWLKDHPDLQARDIKLFRGFKPVSPSHLMITYLLAGGELDD